jgi:hypothetical protein
LLTRPASTPTKTCTTQGIILTRDNPPPMGPRPHSILRACRTPNLILVWLQVRLVPPPMQASSTTRPRARVPTMTINRRYLCRPRTRPLRHITGSAVCLPSGRTRFKNVSSFSKTTSSRRSSSYSSRYCCWSSQPTPSTACMGYLTSLSRWSSCSTSPSPTARRIKISDASQPS